MRMTWMNINRSVLIDNFNVGTVKPHIVRGVFTAMWRAYYLLWVGSSMP
jgi:hypothetical protein